MQCMVYSICGKTASGARRCKVNSTREIFPFNSILTLTHRLASHSHNLFSIFSLAMCVCVCGSSNCSLMQPSTRMHMQTKMSQCFFSLCSYSSALSSSSTADAIVPLKHQSWHTYIFFPFNLPEQTCWDRLNCASTNGKTRLHMFQYSCFATLFFPFHSLLYPRATSWSIYSHTHTRARKALLNHCKKKKRYICLHCFNYLHDALAINGCLSVCACVVYVYSYFTHQMIGHRQNENKQEQKPELQRKKQQQRRLWTS